MNIRTNVNETLFTQDTYLPSQSLMYPNPDVCKSHSCILQPDLAVESNYSKGRRKGYLPTFTMNAIPKTKERQTRVRSLSLPLPIQLPLRNPIQGISPPTDLTLGLGLDLLVAGVDISKCRARDRAQEDWERVGPWHLLAGSSGGGGGGRSSSIGDFLSWWAEEVVGRDHDGVGHHGCVDLGRGGGEGAAGGCGCGRDVGSAAEDNGEAADDGSHFVVVVAVVGDLCGVG